MKLKLLLSIMAVSLMTISASDHEQDATDGRASPLGSSTLDSAKKRQAAAANRSPKGTPTKAGEGKGDLTGPENQGKTTQAKGGLLAKVRGVFTKDNAKALLTKSGKTGMTASKAAVVVAGAAITADAYALLTTGLAHGCSTLFGTNVAVTAATGLTSVPMVSLPAGAVVVGGIVLLPTAAVAVNLVNQFLPEKLKFKKTEKFLKGWTAWGVNTLAMAGAVGFMEYQKSVANVGGSAPKRGHLAPSNLGQAGGK